MITDLILIWALVKLQAPIWVYAFAIADICIKLIAWGVKVGEQSK